MVFPPEDILKLIAPNALAVQYGWRNSIQPAGRMSTIVGYRKIRIPALRMPCLRTTARITFLFAGDAGLVRLVNRRAAVAAMRGPGSRQMNATVDER
jgi:hypothetical protein